MIGDLFFGLYIFVVNEKWWMSQRCEDITTERVVYWYEVWIDGDIWLSNSKLFSNVIQTLIIFCKFENLHRLLFMYIIGLKPLKFKPILSSLYTEVTYITCLINVWMKNRHVWDLFSASKWWYISDLIWYLDVSHLPSFSSAGSSCLHDHIWNESHSLFFHVVWFG